MKRLIISIAILSLINIPSVKAEQYNSSDTINIKSPLIVQQLKPIALQPLEEIQKVWLPPPSPGLNLYEPGQCTWGVANKRFVPNTWGNADTWFYNAIKDGYPTGDIPQKGAIAVRIVGMHVGYVEDVNSNGTFQLYEMNYDYVPYHERVITSTTDNWHFIYY